MQDLVTIFSLSSHRRDWVSYLRRRYNLAYTNHIFRSRFITHRDILETKRKLYGLTEDEAKKIGTKTSSKPEAFGVARVESLL